MGLDSGFAVCFAIVLTVCLRVKVAGLGYFGVSILKTPQTLNLNHTVSLEVAARLPASLLQRQLQHPPPKLHLFRV